jgi:hypothetical protein
MLCQKPVLVVAMLCSGLASSFAAESKQVDAVLELFTSQGCSSCPPADELFEEYSKRPDVVALSYSVDYWDYQGWKDTLAEHEFTERQKSYAAARGDRQVYTPQIVVNGRVHTVGSDKDAIAKAIAQGPQPRVPIEVGMMGDAVSVSVGGAETKTPGKATLWLVLYDRHVRVPVGRGENRNRTLDYYNVVRRMYPVAVWRGQPIKVDLPMGKYHQSDADGCALLLQEETAEGAAGPIIGAARIEGEEGRW